MNERPITVEFSMTSKDRYKVVAVYRSAESAQAACASLASQRTEQQAGAEPKGMDAKALAEMLAVYIKHYDDRPSMEYVRLTRSEAERIRAALAADKKETP